MSRYTDVADEPITSTLPPIEGYEDLPLVTLEEAIKPVAHHFNGIDSCACIAKENSLNPADGLTQDESASIYLYTMECNSGPSLHLVLNQHLRAANREMLKPWLPFLKLFLTALDKLPSHSMTVWRVISDRSLGESYPIGRQVIWWGVSSCMLMKSFSQNREMADDQSVKTLFSIESRNAKLITAHSSDKDSGEEFVLLPGTCLKVINQVPVNEPCQGQLISLREIAVVFTSRALAALASARIGPAPARSEMEAALSYLDRLYPNGQPINPMLSTERPDSGAYKPEVESFFELVLSWQYYNVDFGRAYNMMRHPELIATAFWPNLKGLLVCFTRLERDGSLAYARAIENGQVQRILLRVKELLG